jgi:hypothetical protein
VRVVYYMGCRDWPSVRLSDAERRTLARAAVILTGLRELREDDDLTTDIALAAHLCCELSEREELES